MAYNLDDETLKYYTQKLKEKLATKEEVPTKTSELTNDSGYLTEHQDISELQPKNDDALTTTDKTVIGSINELNTNKADKNDIPSLSGYATETYVNNTIANSTYMVFEIVTGTFSDNRTIEQGVDALLKANDIHVNQIYRGGCQSSDKPEELINCEIEVTILKAEKLNYETYDYVCQVILSSTDTSPYKWIMFTRYGGNNASFITTTLPLRPMLPSENLSEYTNDVGFLTEHQDISNLQSNTDNNLLTTDKTIVGSINELFQSVSNGKELIATAITDKGVNTSSDDTFQTIAENISAIENKNNVCPSWYSTILWTDEVSNMTTVRAYLTSSAVNNKIYCIGGYNNNISHLSVNEEYDPLTNTWVTKTNMPTGRYGLTSSVVNNKIYAIGGGNNSYLSINEEYDPLTNTWVSKANMTTVRAYLTSSAVNNKIYCIGGYNNNISHLSVNEEYDPLTDTWTSKTNMPNTRRDLTSSVVNDKIYCIGGYRSSSNSYLSVNEEYDPLTDTWTSKTNMPTARAYLTSSAVNNKIYVIGGYRNSTLISNEEYDPITNTWTSKSSMINARCKFTSSIINNQIYIIGGYNRTSVTYLKINECCIIIG